MITLLKVHSKKFPLHAAARYGYIEAYFLILENFQNKNPEDYNRSVPLHFAAENGHLDLCKLILENLDNFQVEAPRIIHGECQYTVFKN